MLAKSERIRRRRPKINDEEATYIAADAPAVASLVVHRVLEAVAQLEQQAGIGRPGRVPNTRELVILNTRYIEPSTVPFYGPPGFANLSPTMS